MRKCLTMMGIIYKIILENDIVEREGNERNEHETNQDFRGAPDGRVWPEITDQGLGSY